MDQSEQRHRSWQYWAMGLAVFVATGGAPSIGQTPTGAPARPPANPNAPLMVLSPKAKSAGWTGVHKPHTKLADVLARHKGQADWAETIVDDESLFAQWISMGPGKKTPRRMNGDTREWWIVQSGTLRFTVDGREPVIATKGVMVQVPYRMLYQIEGLDEFEADEGDVVYVPRQTWHLASFGGQEGLRSCRLAMNGFPYQAHMFEAD